MPGQCAIPSCTSPASAYGYCARHREQWRRRGPVARPSTADERFDRRWRLDPATGCHIWLRGKDTAGYGQFPIGDMKHVRAHVYAWVRKNGPVPTGLVLDHVVCDNTSCCNPDHLAPTTRERNQMRSGKSVGGVNERKDKCDRGHPFTPENTYRPPRGGRQCRECRRTVSVARGVREREERHGRGLLQHSSRRVGV